MDSQMRGAVKTRLAETCFSDKTTQGLFRSFFAGEPDSQATFNFIVSTPRKVRWVGGMEMPVVVAAVIGAGCFAREPPGIVVVDVARVLVEKVEDLEGERPPFSTPGPTTEAGGIAVVSGRILNLADAAAR